MATILYMENDCGEFDKIGEYASIPQAEKAMLESYDSGKCVDYRITSNGNGFRSDVRYPSYKLYQETCPRCGEEERVFRMFQTRDYHGILFRRVCSKCYDKVLARGYDGEKYGPEDECLDYDY